MLAQFAQISGKIFTQISKEKRKKMKTKCIISNSDHERDIIIIFVSCMNRTRARSVAGRWHTNVLLCPDSEMIMLSGLGAK